MLARLSISNFAIIEQVEIELTPGLNVLTGETGAGKSIVVDAVSALLGSRFGADAIRTGADGARIEGVFEVTPSDALRHALDELGVELDDGCLILGREINRSGRSLGRINGRIVPVGVLQTVGRCLIDLHGQGDHLALLRAAEHVNYLDGFANLLGERAEAGRRITELRALRRERQKLLDDQRERARRIDLLQFQVEEISSANLQAEEEDTLRRDLSRLANAERLAADCATARDALVEREGRSAVDTVGEALTAVTALVKLDPDLADDRLLLEQIADQIGDVARRLRTYAEQIEFSPDRLVEVEERLNLIRNLERKYGSTIANVLTFWTQSTAELDQLTHTEERQTELDAKEAALLAALGPVLADLSRQRAVAAGALAGAVEGELAGLGMARAHFAVDQRQIGAPDGVALPDGRRVAFDLTGIDTIEFMIAPNPGETARPLVRIASGGETARLVLALKTALARVDSIPTLILDEVDSGIGGRVGHVVGQKLAALGRERQIISVTHLPQIAAFADRHLGVRKWTDGERTRTLVENLDAPARVAEIAVMLSGRVDQVEARAAAERLLLEADAWKRRDEPAPVVIARRGTKGD